MNVNELYGLTKWIQQNIIDLQIQEKYQNLLSILQNNSQPNQQQPFENEKEDLLETLAVVHLDALTKDQISFLTSLGIAPSVGLAGKTKIDDILFRNSIDVVTAAEKIQEIINEISQGIEKSNQLSTGLEGCILDYEEGEENEVLIRVSFLEKASISNVNDFKKWGSEWHDIGRGIAIAHNMTPEDIKIIGANKGSVILDLLACAAIAKRISSIILEILTIIEKVMQIRKIAIESKHKQLLNKELESQIQEQAQKTKENGATDIMKKQIKELKLAKEHDGDKITALEKAVSKLIEFIDNGGELDFVIPEEDFDDEDEGSKISELTELKTTYGKIKSIEERIKLLEYKTDVQNSRKDNNTEEE